MTLKEHYKQILSEMGKVPTTPKEKKLAAHYGDKNKITRGDVITAAKKKKGLDEMAMTKAALKSEINKLNKIKKGKKGEHREITRYKASKREDRIAKQLASPTLFDVGPKGRLKSVGKLAGGRQAGESLTWLARFGNRYGGYRPKPETIKSAKELAKQHGIFYTGMHPEEDDWVDPRSTITAVGGKRGPGDAFVRLSKTARRYT